MPDRISDAIAGQAPAGRNAYPGAARGIPAGSPASADGGAVRRPGQSRLLAPALHPVVASDRPAASHYRLRRRAGGGGDALDDPHDRLVRRSGLEYRENGGAISPAHQFYRHGWGYDRGIAGFALD